MKIQTILYSIILIFLITSTAHSRNFKEIQKDALTVGMLTSNAPFGKMNESSLNGIEYEMAAALAKKMGVRFRIIKIDNVRDGIKKLKKDRIDLLLATVKESSGAGIAYSIPYYKTGLGIMTSANNNRIFSAIDLNNKYVAAVAGSTGTTFLKKFIQKAKVELVTTYSQTYDLLLNNEVDAIVADKVILDYEASLNPRLKTIDLTLTEEEYVIGVNPKYSKFLKLVNKSLKSLFETNAINDILAKYKVPPTIKVQPDPSSFQSNSNTNTSSSMTLEEKVEFLMKEVERLDTEIKRLK